MSRRRRDDRTRRRRSGDPHLHQRPAGTIVIAKDAKPNDPQSFGFFSGALGNFACR
jgi:hypothetical protein